MICGKPGLKRRQSDSRAWILNAVLGFELGIEGKGVWGRRTVFLTKWRGQGAGEALRLEKGATPRSPGRRGGRAGLASSHLPGSAFRVSAETEIMRP